MTPTKTAQRRYGRVEDAYDPRDVLLSPAAVVGAVSLPPVISLRGKLPPSFNQGDLGSCTGNALAGAALFAELQAASAPVPDPSRLFIYYGERVIEGTVGQDDGAQIRDGAKVLARSGVCSEDLWPYDTTKFADRPSAPAFADALKHRATAYNRVPREEVRQALFAGHPVVLGFTVYESFESQQVASTGIMPMPSHGEKVLGGHAVLAVGYDDHQQRYEIRNSWGPDWGDHGHFWMPYQYLRSSKLSSDFWVIIKEAA